MIEHFAIEHIDFSDGLSQEIKQCIDTKTKPVNSLGLLENIALQIARIQNTLKPKLRNPNLIIFAADHGALIPAANGTNPGVELSLYPHSVTESMLNNFVSGGAAANVFARQYSIHLNVVDAGICTENLHSSSQKEIALKKISTDTSFIDASVSQATRNYLLEDAMTDEQLNDCIRKSKEIVHEIHKKSSNIILLGEMGIGNTSSASLIHSLILSLPLAECVGKGTGLSKEGIERKIELLEKVIARHVRDHSKEVNVLGILKSIGGFEIAMLVGAILAAAEKKMIILIDGYICSTACLLAYELYPEVLNYCIFTHCSAEKGHKSILEFLGKEPLLQLKLCLGEGTGGLLAYGLLQSSVSFFNEMSTFESAGVPVSH